MPIETVAALENALSTPTPALVEAMGGLDGDVLILGVGGKMGPSLARLARRALDEAGRDNRVIGVARFSTPALADELRQAGVETIRCDLLDADAVGALPDAPNVLFLAGRKFGSSGDPSLTWAMNTYVPSVVAQRFRDSRIVVFSSGNVYPFVPVASGGATEDTLPDPVGEYAQSVLGRERMFQYFSGRHGTPVAILRINYAIDLRYGVLVDIAQKVRAGDTIDLRMGHANVIWQGDANAVALRTLAHCTSPPTVLNVTGPATIRVRDVANRFGKHFGVEPVFENTEAPTALLSDASRCAAQFGRPSVSVEQMIEQVAHWASIGGATHDKPTHFETRDGRF